MIADFETVVHELTRLISLWEPRLARLPVGLTSGRRNSQDRTIKQILGHMIDSASNNTHRIVHLQYQESPFRFPNYASGGNNDRWIAIQHYQEEDWGILVNLWKYANLHIVHVIRHVDPSRLNGQWYCSDDKLISLKDGIMDYLRHFRLHLDEIAGLINIQINGQP